MNEIKSAGGTAFYSRTRDPRIVRALGWSVLLLLAVIRLAAAATPDYILDMELEELLSTEVTEIFG